MRQCLQVPLPNIVLRLKLVLNTIEGGSDTTRATLNVFVAAMATDPEFLVRVRKELDAVCGDAERLPTFDDQVHLPLVTACVKEVMRWRPLNSAGTLLLYRKLTIGVVRV